MLHHSDSRPRQVHAQIVGRQCTGGSLLPLDQCCQISCMTAVRAIVGSARARADRCSRLSRVSRGSSRLQAEDMFNEPGWRSALRHVLLVRTTENVPGQSGLVTREEAAADEGGSFPRVWLEATVTRDGRGPAPSARAPLGFPRWSSPTSKSCRPATGAPTRGCRSSPTSRGASLARDPR